MTLTDKNKIFFALIHYVLVEQKNVDWILKTSLIDFTGISSLLEERAYKTDTILDDVVDMVTQIKPYHVQFSHYFEHYQTHQEDVDVNVKDKLETTVHMRFDALKSTPDLNIIFDDYITKNSLPTGQKEDVSGNILFNYDKEGIIIYFQKENKFYIRKKEGNLYAWIPMSISIYDDGFYYCERIDGIKYESKDSGYYKGNNGSIEKYNPKNIIDTHRANRLFYLGLHDNEEIKKELNANFKGLEITDSAFDIGKFGYDIFNYDTTDYDSPTIIYDYYFLNDLINDLIIRNTDQSIAKTITGAKTEINDLFHYNNIPVTKTFFSTSKERFDIPVDWTNDDTYKVFKMINGNLIEYQNFEAICVSHYIDIFSTMKDREKVYVLKYSNGSNRPNAAHIAECTIFEESNSKTLRRKIVYIVDNTETYNLPVPSTLEGSNDKIAVQKVTYRGTRMPVLSPNIENGNLVQSLIDINVYEHISMVSFDFKYLYDKIYTWEDKYGRSNNVIYLDGENFYRARYEEDRPSELVVSSPLNTLFVYNDDEKNNNIFFNDFKNKQLKTSILYGMYKEIVNVDIGNNGTLNYIQLNSVDGLEEAPGKVLINSEIILYNNLDKENNKISELKRSCDGTFLYIDGISTFGYHTTHNIGDKVYPIHEDEWSETKRNNVYKSYTVKSSEDKVYDCPSGLKKSSTIKVKKLSKINLIEDVKLNTKVIKISSPEVVDMESYETLMSGQIPDRYIILPDGTRIEKKWVLKINSDSIPFKTIYPDPSSNNYCIEDFTLPEEYISYGNNIIYSASDAIISGCITSFINDYSVQIVEGDDSFDIVVDGDETYVVTTSGDKLFRIVGSNISNSGEILELGNVVNIYCTARNDITDDFYQDEVYFGTIGKDNLLYKDDGTVYGKIEGNKLVQIMTQVTINDYLNKNDNILINIHNFKYSSDENSIW